MIWKRLFYNMKTSKPLLILLTIVIVILFLVLGLGGYLLLSNSTLDDSTNEPIVNETMDNPVIYKSHINDLVLNVTNSKGREKLMKLSFSIKSSEPMIEQVTEENREIIVDKVILLISSRSSEELLTVGGKALFKEELVDEINMALNEVVKDNENLQQNMVKKILYTSFVMK